MKLLVSTLLLLFMIYLSTPTVLMLIEKNANVSLNYDLSDEENQKENKEFNSDFTLKAQFELVTFNSILPKIIFSENEAKHDAISEEIFIPPPKLI
jgi:hypothetical protein